MAECPGGRTNRGIRTQFRLGTPGLGLLKGLYPIHVGDIMEAEQPSQTGFSSARDLISPSKGTRTRTVREYEETIDELQKENFDLKLKLHFYENPKKFSCKGKSDYSPDKDIVQIHLDLKLETESLRKDLAYKEKVLQEALERAEKYEIDFKELENKYTELQNELSSLSELPSKQEFLSLLDEKENLLKQIELLEQNLSDKDIEIQGINEKIEILADKNTLLEEKIKKRNLAIQSFVLKNVQESKLFPEEIRNIVHSATQAAKNQNKDELVVAIKSFSSALNKILSSSIHTVLDKSEEKENIGSPRAKCLKEEFLENTSAFLPSQTDSFSEISHIESLKEVLSERNTPSQKQFDSLDATVNDSYVKSKILHENSVNVSEKDILECLKFSSVSPSSVGEEKLKISNSHSSQSCAAGENDLIDIENISLPSVSSDLYQEGLSKSDVSLKNNTEKSQLIEENERLKIEIKEKFAVIQDLKDFCEELKLRNMNLQERKSEAFKASGCYSACTQTDIVGSNLLNEYEKTKIQKDAKLSSDVDQLREDVLLLLLAVEDKNKELNDIKQTLALVQEDLNNALNTSNSLIDKEYMNERNELHERLAFSSSLNVELMKHLKNLEAFMEDLLQHNLDSSMDSTIEKSSFLSNVSRCLNASLKLSNALSDHLSFCEASKLFEECESVLYRSTNICDVKSLPNLNVSNVSVPVRHSSSYPGTHHLEEYIPFVKKNDEVMNKELDSSQLCWRCWQQLNSFPVLRSDTSHVVQNASPKYMPYASSDSDIWSEPDRNVSMQRIGISLQNSPVFSKSPRKLRLKEKRMPNKIGSNLDTSSSEMQRWSKQRRHGSVSRRLFARESTRYQDFTSEKFYFFLAEKYSKFNVLLEALENIKDGEITNEDWQRMNAVVSSVKEALQKLHVAKENAKSLSSAVCGKCVMLELFMDLKTSHKEADFYISNSSTENEILQQFQKEVHLIKEACKEPFSLLTESVCKRSQSSQNDPVADNELAQINEWQMAVIDLNDTNKNLNKDLEEVKKLLSKEREMLKLGKLENRDLCNQINNLKKELFDMKEKSEEISLKNEKLVEELAHLNAQILKLSDKESMNEMQLNRSDLVDREKVKINELEDVIIGLNDKIKTLSGSLEEVNILLCREKEMLQLAKSENLDLCSQISSLKEFFAVNQEELSLKNKELVEELMNMERKNLELNSYLSNLEGKRKESGIALEMFESVKSENLELYTQINQLKRELMNMKQRELSSKREKLVEKLMSASRSSDSSFFIKGIEEDIKESSIDIDMLENVKSENLQLCEQIYDLKQELLDWRQKELFATLKNKELIDELAYVNKLNAELNSLKDLEEKKKKSNAALDQRTDDLQVKLELATSEKLKIEELEDVIADLSNKNKGLNESLEEVKRMLTNEKNKLQLAKSENFELCNQINNLKKELSDMKQKERELSVKNEEIFLELKRVTRNNAEQNSILKSLEDKRKESTIALDQLSAELQKNKSNLTNMNEKCVEYEKKLNEQIRLREEYEEKLKHIEYTSSNEKEALYNNIHDLTSEKQFYQEELESIKCKQFDLEQENATLSASLTSKCSELLSLQETISLLQNAKESLSFECKHLENELNIAKEDLQRFQKQCSVYENEVLEKFKANEEEYCQKLKQLESKSLNEKKKLLAEISKITLEREDILQKLNTEKESYERLTAEKDELSHKINESCEQISSLQLLNQELKTKQHNLLQRNEFFENALLSSNSECESLSKDLKSMRETLQNLESKCMMYEKELVATAGVKDSLIECLLNINREFSSQRQKLNEICKAYSSEANQACDETSVSEFIPVIDDDNVKILCGNLCLESKKLMQSVNILIELLKSFYLKSVETKAAEETYNLKTDNIRNQVEFHKAEGNHLKCQNDHLQHVIDELQMSISEKEKSIQCSAYEVQTLKEKIHNSQEEIEKGKRLLNRKDEEVAMLQDRVFNLQSYVNTLMAEKSNIQQKSPTIYEKAQKKTDSVSSIRSLPSQPVIQQASKAVQTNELIERSQSTDESFVSVSSPERKRNSCCEKYLKNYQSLQTKLALSNTRIEMLEKEKNDLRECYLSQIRANCTSEEKEESINEKLINLELKLEQKKAFINELKAELLKTCNSLIDKEKELDDLKEKLSNCEKKSKCAVSEISSDSITSPNAVDVNIRNLRNYKWQLIQTIFDIQKKFYEKRGIHLNYIDKFRDHVNNLYSIQLSHTLSKSESMPLLESPNLKLSSNLKEDKLKNLVEMELDIECLENLKIFLNRFFVPCVLQTSQDIDASKPSCLDIERKLSMGSQSENLGISKLESLSFSGISFPTFIPDHLMPEDKLLPERNLSFENFVSKVSYYLDCLENCFTAIKKCQWSKSFDLPAKETTNKANVKTLLLKIFEEIKILQDNADKLFNFSTLLKNFDFVVTSSIPFNLSRPDVSDRESLMSEETIGISRSESPLSFEELCPLKLPSHETLMLEGHTLKPKSVRGKGSVSEPYNAKITTIGSSCDSVCQRSHYSSPDLGIESDPNHESSAPEHKEEGIVGYQKITMEEKRILIRPPPKTVYTETESAGRYKGIKVSGTLYSIGKLPQYELLKREIQESLVGIKSVLSRTGDGLHHVAKYTSPRKTLEYSTLKAIKDSCANIEVCLKKAYSLVGKFWIAPCPSEKEWKALMEENQGLIEQIGKLTDMVQKQEREYKKATRKLEHAQLINANMEKKISKKLVKTKKNIRQVELKLLENLCQNLPPVPKYPSDQANSMPQQENV